MKRKLRRIVLREIDKPRDSVSAMTYRDLAEQGIVPGTRGTVMIDEPRGFTMHVRYDGVGKLFIMNRNSKMIRPLDVLEALSEL